MPDLTDLRVLLDVVERGSISAAARRLGLAQSTVSRRVARLERELGVALLTRQEGRTVPTAAGRQALGFAAGTVAAYDQLAATLRSTGPGLRGRLRIMSSTAPATFLPALLAGFRQRHPDVRFEVEVADTAAVTGAVAGQRADLGCCGAPPQDARLRHVAIAADEIVLVVPRSHPAAAAGRLELADLAAAQVVRREAGSATQARLRAALAARGLDLDALACAVTVDTAGAVVDAVRAGLGIGAVSRTALSHVDDVVGVTLDGVDLHRELWLVWRAADAGREPLASFVAAVRAAANDRRG